MQIPKLNENQSDTKNCKNNIEIVKLFCIGYSRLNELQVNKVSINDPLYLKCLEHMKAHQLPNHIKMPPQYNNFIKRVNTKHIILEKENQIKTLSNEMHKIQTTQFIDLLEIVNNSNSKSTSIRNHYQQLFLQIQYLKQQIKELNQVCFNKPDMVVVIVINTAHWSIANVKSYC
ncbi:hypothetical protein ACTA71_002679 [Dictyostelium dimigraforme]